MTQKQNDALRKLQNAIEDATTSGLFDVLAISLHPDIINKFADAVYDLSDAA